jgi:hypothetical protein
MQFRVQTLVYGLASRENRSPEAGL